MGLTLDDIKEYIPYYLTQEAKQGIVKALGDFPEKINYYTIRSENDLLQGDGWSCLDVMDIETGKHKAVKGIVLSNSCDVSIENARSLPAKIVFAPIIPLHLYKELLVRRGVVEDAVFSKIDAIKSQKVSSIFYLPKGGCLDCDYIAVLDDLHSLPLNFFSRKCDKKRQFTLSQVGFYLFLFKLSIHFCRFHENVLRDPACSQTD